MYSNEVASTHLSFSCAHIIVIMLPIDLWLCIAEEMVPSDIMNLFVAIHIVASRDWRMKYLNVLRELDGLSWVYEMFCDGYGVWLLGSDVPRLRNYINNSHEYPLKGDLEIWPLVVPTCKYYANQFHTMDVALSTLLSDDAMDPLLDKAHRMISDGSVVCRQYKGAERYAGSDDHRILRSTRHIDLNLAVVPKEFPMKNILMKHLALKTRMTDTTACILSTDDETCFHNYYEWVMAPHIKSDNHNIRRKSYDTHHWAEFATPMSNGGRLKLTYQHSPIDFPTMQFRFRSMIQGSDSRQLTQQNGSEWDPVVTMLDFCYAHTDKIKDIGHIIAKYYHSYPNLVTLGNYDADDLDWRQATSVFAGLMRSSNRYSHERANQRDFVMRSSDFMRAISILCSIPYCDVRHAEYGCIRPMASPRRERPSDRQTTYGIIIRNKMMNTYTCQYVLRICDPICITCHRNYPRTYRQ